MDKILFESKSTLDKKAWIKTVIFCFLPIIIFGFLGLRNYTFLYIGMCIFFVGMLILGVLYTPNHYILTEYKLIIKRYLGDIEIPLDQINTIRLFKQEEGIIRLFAAGGVFGNFGLYWSATHKRLHVYTRRDTNWVIIMTQNKKYVIAPDNLQLIDAAQAKINLAFPDSAQSDIPVAIKKSGQLQLYLVIATMIPILFLLYLGYKEPDIQCTSDMFEVTGIWGMSIPIAEISKVDTIVWDDMPDIILRTNGISVLKVNRGAFKLEDINNARLSVERNNNPVIRIIDHAGKYYFINRRNPNETRSLYTWFQNFDQTGFTTN